MARFFMRKSLAAVMAAATAITGVGVTTSSPARAAIGDGSQGHQWFSLQGGPSQETMIAYSNFIASLRVAVSVSSRDRGFQTQNNAGAVTRVSLTAMSGHAVDLYVQPHNLYLVGFAAQGASHSYALNDMTGPWRNLVLGGGYYETPFGGAYGDLSSPSNANRSREEMPLSFWDVDASIERLYNVGMTSRPVLPGDRENLARAVMNMIQFISESARFNDVHGTFRALMQDGSVRRNGLPLWQAALENRWDQISIFFYETSRGINRTPITIPNGGPTISTPANARQYVHVFLGSHDSLPPREEL